MAISLFGQQINAGDQLHVNAHGGLNLRESPVADGGILKLLPFGQKVIIQSIADDTINLGGTKGQWVEVKVIGQKGYVFDYYLTSLPVTKPTEVKNCWYPSLKKYLLEQLEPIDSAHYNNQIDGESRHVMNIYDLKGGHQLIDHSYWESFELEIQLKEVRPSEVFQLLKNFTEFCGQPLENILKVGYSQAFSIEELCCDMDIVKTYNNIFVIRLRGGP